jgi:hypothetical protein
LVAASFTTVHHMPDPIQASISLSYKGRRDGMFLRFICAGRS